MKPYIPLLVAAAASAACANAAAERRVSQAALQAEATITAEDIHHRIAFLASDDLAGRDTPSEGLETAAAWIAEEFQRFGLEPGADGGWLQRYPYPLEQLETREARIEISGGATHALEYGAEFFAHAGAAPVHAVGAVYLAHPGELDRGPQSGLRDRAVLVRLPGMPESARDGLRFGARARSDIATAVERSRRAGAAAVVFVMDARVTAGEVGALAATAEAPSRTLGGRATIDEPAVFFITDRAAQRVLRMAGLDATDLLRQERVDRPVPLPGITVRLAAPVAAVDQARPPNVVGLLPGGHPSLGETYVVITAHMDHVGIGRPDATGDSIYNGADDNASGTAALMAIARAFGALPAPPDRSVIFLAVSGEEKGLLGSRWFVENPTVPLESIVANINLDMIGRNAPDSIVAIGKEYSTLGPLLREVATTHPQLGLTVAPDLWPGQRFFYRSDHFSFAAREIPAIFLFAGTHEDYHRPGDTVEKVDFDKTARVARLAFLLALEIAQQERPPEWDPQGLDRVRTMTRR